MTVPQDSMQNLPKSRADERLILAEPAYATYLALSECSGTIIHRDC